MEKTITNGNSVVEKNDKRKTTSIKNAEKARLAKLEKTRLRKEQEEKLNALQSKYPKDDDGSSSDDEQEIVYIPMKKTKKKIPEVKETKSKKGNNTDELKREIEELKRTLRAQTSKAEPQKPNAELMNHFKAKILNF